MPATSVAMARSACSSSIWRCKRGSDLARDDLAGPRVPIAGDALVLVRGRANRPGRRPARILERNAELAEASCRSGNSAGPALARGLRASGRARRRAAWDIARAGEIGLGIGAIFDRMVGVEELRRVDDRRRRSGSRHRACYASRRRRRRHKAARSPQARFGRRSSRPRRWSGSGRRGALVSTASARARSALDRRPRSVPGRQPNGPQSGANARPWPLVDPKARSPFGLEAQEIVGE